MADGKDDKRPPSPPTPVNRRRRDEEDATSRSLLDDMSADPLIKALRHLGDEMMHEPVPDRLLGALGKKPSSGKKPVSES